MLDVKKETIALTTQDGIRLEADLYRPDTQTTLPVLLMRQPYGRAIASTVVYAHPRWYAAQGYLVVIQDVRGRGSSQGEFRLFTNEAADGAETIAWAAKLPGSNGQVGMYGFSYQGMTQLYAAASHLPALKTIVPAMIGFDLYQDWAYEGGAFCLQANLGWAIQLAAETARRRGDEAAFLALRQASQHLPLQGPIPSQPELLQQLAPDSFYHDWIQHSDSTDAYWQALKPDLTGLDLPILHIGGWFDPYLRGSLRFYQTMLTHCTQPQHLWIGPWLHLPWGRQGGAIDYGSAAGNPIDQLQLRWFNHFLKGIDTGILEEPPIHLFTMGKNQWQALDHWPAQSNMTCLLHSSGLAALRDGEGHLEMVENSPPQSTDPLIPIQENQVNIFSQGSAKSSHGSIDILVHDPWRPVPAVGGHATFPGGSFNRRAIDDRSDVLTYTTDPLPEELQIVGDLRVEVFCQTEALSFDLCAVLSEVRPEGVFNFSQGYRRVDRQPNHQSVTKEPLLVTVTLQPTCMVIAAGHALRLSLSAACFPAYAVNPGTGQNPNWGRTIEAQVITLMILNNQTHQSKLHFHVKAQ